jgi:hypothetical protein
MNVLLAGTVKHKSPDKISGFYNLTNIFWSNYRTMNEWQKEEEKLRNNAKVRSKDR